MLSARAKGRDEHSVRAKGTTVDLAVHSEETRVQERPNKRKFWALHREFQTTPQQGLQAQHQEFRTTRNKDYQQGT